MHVDFTHIIFEHVLRNTTVPSEQTASGVKDIQIYKNKWKKENRE